MIELVISGFQDGADIGGIRAAYDAGFRTGGWMPRGFKTESGPRPEYRDFYGAGEHELEAYPPRTRLNAEMADVTLWFGKDDSAGYRCTRKACEDAGKPFWEIRSRETEPWQLAHRLLYYQFKVVNVAGGRESKSPGMEAAVYEYLSEVFRIMKGA